MHYKWSKLLSTHLDGLLDSKQASRMETHLSECNDCRTLFEEMRQVDTQLRQLENKSAPKGFSRRVMSAVRVSNRRRTLASSWYIKPAMLMLFLVVFMSGSLSGSYLAFSLMNVLEERSQQYRNTKQVYALASFDPLPVYSFGSTYISLLEESHE